MSRDAAWAGGQSSMAHSSGSVSCTSRDKGTAGGSNTRCLATVLEDQIDATWGKFSRAGAYRFMRQVTSAAVTFFRRAWRAYAVTSAMACVKKASDLSMTDRQRQRGL